MNGFALGRRWSLLIWINQTASVPPSPSANPPRPRPGGMLRQAPRYCAILVFALALAAPGCLTGAADTDTGLGQLMQQLAQRQHGHVSFVERHFIPILDRSIETSGALFY